MQPNTPEWLLARACKVTGSRVGDILPGKSGKYLKSRQNYLIEKYIELRTGEPFEKFQGNGYTEAGSQAEPYAIAAYEADTGNLVETLAIAPHPTIECLQASPDGLVDSDGCIEVKSRVTGNTLFDHFECMTADAMPDKYMPQVQTVMICADRQWCDFISWCEQMPEDERLFVKRVERDDEYIARIESEVVKFWAEVQQQVERLAA